MAIYNINNIQLNAIYSAGGVSKDIAYDVLNNIVFNKEIPPTPPGPTPPEPPTPPSHYLQDYSIFVPQDVSDQWNTGAVNGRTLNVSQTDFYNLFYEDYLTNPPTGLTVTKSSIGRDQSDTYDVYEYDFCPADYERTILLSSGMHTYELSASFGLANFINNLYSSENDDNEAFQYIRKYVRIKIIPIVNPWGFNQSPKKYGNVNGVNPNRNFDYNNRWDSFNVYTPAQNEWNVKGEHPFSEVEVTNLAKWVNDNCFAEFWIDCHTDVGNSSFDLDIYSLSESAVANRIDNAITKIQEWFKSTYSVGSCVTKHLLDNAGSIRQFWGEYAAAMPTFTPEQCTARTTFGTSYNNDSGDISNYSTNISTLVQEFLLAQYADSTVVEITSAVDPEDVSINISTGSYSATIESTLTPANTTQNKFEWKTSDDTVAKVYGGSNKAIVVGVGNGTAVITGTNRYDTSIVISCTVTVTGYALPNAITLGCELGSIDSTTGEETLTNTRLRTDYIDISHRTWLSAVTIRDLLIEGNIASETAIRLYDSEHVYLGNLNVNYWSGLKNGGWAKGVGAWYDTSLLSTATYIRLVFRGVNNGAITSASGTFRIMNTTYSFSL